MGGLTGDALTDGSNNVAIGTFALSTDDLGSFSTALGYNALANQNYASATDGYNTAVGARSGQAITTGIRNTYVGALAGDGTQDADFNTAVGFDALSSNVLGSKSVAIGSDALTAMNPVDGSGNNQATDMLNTAVGYHAGVSVSTGVQNVLVGGQAGDALQDADFNIAIGVGALGSDTNGHRSVAVGHSALGTQNFSSSSNSNNTAIGFDAGAGITTGIKNTFVGSLAGDLTDDGEENVAVGYQSLSNQNGDSNTACGSIALSVCTGNSNTAIGRAAGFQIESGDNNIAVGADALRTGSPGGAVTTGNNVIGLGDENISSFNCQVALTVASDERDKTDFTDLNVGLDFVKQLKPYTYRWDKRSKYGDKTANNYDLNAQTPDGTHKEDWLDVGFKAQEVEALEKAAGYDKANKTNLAVTISEDGKQYGMQYEKLIPILTKAIQELEARITALEGE